MSKICFIRHGETDWNKLGRLQGQTNIALNSAGKSGKGGALVIVATQGSSGFILDEDADENIFSQFKSTHISLPK